MIFERPLPGIGQIPCIDLVLWLISLVKKLWNIGVNESGSAEEEQEAEVENE